MSGKFSVPRFPQEDRDATQELPQLPEEFEPIALDPIPDYIPPAARPAPPEEDYDPDGELPEDFIDVALRFLKAHWKKLVLILLALILAVTGLTVGLTAAKNRDPYDEKILGNVMLGNVLVGGMTKNEAAAALNASLAPAYSTKSMTVDLGEQILTLTPDQTGAKLNVQAAVEAAYSYGRTGTQAEKEQAYQLSLTANHIIGLLPYLELDQDYIRQTLLAISASTVSTLTQPSYYLEGDAANFTTDYFDPDSSAQTLVITLGTPQVDFDSKALLNAILDAYSLGQFQVTGQGPATTALPEPVDLNAIYEEFYLAPKAATLNMTTFTTIPGSFGREFDLAAAQALVASAQYGQVIRIPMTYPSPEGDPAAVLYRDVLGTYSTAYPDNENWKQNLKLACRAVDGLVLNPGDTFSFQSTVKVTAEKGYLPAFCGKEETLGGGICQLASALYVAALVSDLEVTARTAHSAPPSYTEYGLEADITGGADLAFRNNTIYPIRLEAELTGGMLKVSFVGTELRSYTVEMESSISQTIQPKIIYEEYAFDNAEGYEDGDVIQSGSNGYEVKIYKRKFDRTTKTLIYREYVSTSSYASQDKIIAQVAPPISNPTDPSPETIPGLGPDVEAVG